MCRPVGAHMCAPNADAHVRLHRVVHAPLGHQAHAPGGTARRVIDSTDAPPRHLLAQPHALAFAHVSLLLQVLRLRHPQGPPVRARRSDRDPRPRRPPPGQGAARAHRRASRGQPRGARAPRRVRARGLHRLRGLDVRTGFGARAPATHEPGRARHARTSRASARGNRLAGADARVGLRAAHADRARRLAHQAPCATPGDDPCGGRAADPIHQRHPRRHRRDARGAHRFVGGHRDRCMPSTAISKR